jgi:hypothetical protein
MPKYNVFYNQGDMWYVVIEADNEQDARENWSDFNRWITEPDVIKPGQMSFVDIEENTDHFEVDE